jgi:copper resistance protein D
LTDTAFGHAWAAHLVLATLLVFVVAFGPRSRWGPAVAASAAVLASLGLVGHASMQTGAEGVSHRANHAVHLLAAGAWIGGLIPFVLSLRAYEDAALRAPALKAMINFSFWGQFVVAAIVITGSINIALTSGRPPVPPTSPYRALLDAKLAIVAIMIALALINRYVLAPRLKPGAAALETLRLTSISEVALGTLVVALVSVFALLDPA